MGDKAIKTKLTNMLGGKNEIQMGGLQKEKVGGLGWEELGVQRC